MVCVAKSQVGGSKQAGTSGAPKRRRGSRIAAELMAELAADPDWVRRKAERDALHSARQQEDAEEFAVVRRALDAAGLPSEDFGRFTSGRHPDVIRQSVFDYKAAVPVFWRSSPWSQRLR